MYRIAAAGWISRHRTIPARGVLMTCDFAVLSGRHMGGFVHLVNGLRGSGGFDRCGRRVSRLSGNPSVEVFCQRRLTLVVVADAQKMAPCAQAGPRPTRLSKCWPNFRDAMTCRSNASRPRIVSTPRNLLKDTEISRSSIAERISPHVRSTTGRFMSRSFRRHQSSRTSPATPVALLT